MLRVGAAEGVITPPLGVELVGYGPSRHRFSTAIQQQLTAQAVVFDDGQVLAAIIACDLLALTPAFVARVRELIAKGTPIPSQNIMVTCTHSHTTPSTGDTREWGRADREYTRVLARTLAGVVGWAHRNLEPVTLHVGRAEHRTLAWNRTGDATLDPSVHTIHAVNQGGNVIAVIGQYSCHPVTLGPITTISPDYPGMFRQHLVHQLPGCIPMFLNGACGDIDPVTNQHVWGQGTFEDVRHHGIQLADTALQAIAAARLLQRPHLGVAQHSLQLEYDFPSAQELRDRIAYYAAESRRQSLAADETFGAVTGEVSIPSFWLRYYRALERRYSLAKFPNREDVELQALVLSADTALVAIPAEVYTEQGLLIQDASPFPTTIPVCYANGCCGYLPPAREFTRGSYTAQLAAAVYDRPPFKPNVADALLDATHHLLAKSLKAKAEA